MDPKNEELVLVELHVVSHLNTHTPDFTTIIVGAAMATVIVLFVVVIAFKKYQSKIRDSI